MFLNPFRYENAYQAHDLLGDRTLWEHNNEVQIETNGFIIKETSTPTEESIEALFESLPRLLQYLRYTSLQFDMKVDGSLYMAHRETKLPNSQALGTQNQAGRRIRGDYYNSMASWQNLVDADKMHSKGMEIPVFEEVLLDAITGKNQSEYRKAILYSAIAVESMLANKYDQLYSVLKKKSENKKFRLINQNSEVKDPIYKALTDKTDFKKLLHEIPLYLLGKSLLLEQEKLYSYTLKLYTTRNKIVHWGAPLNPNYDQMLEINSEGASIAIEIAIKLFQWMGINNFDKIGSVNFIELKGI